MLLIDVNFRHKYPKTFKDKEILVEENDACYFVSTNKDESPLILSKKRYERTERNNGACQ